MTEDVRISFTIVNKMDLPFFQKVENTIVVICENREVLGTLESDANY